MQLGVDAEEIYTIVNKAADAYEGAGSAVDSAAYHARFLRRLVSMDQERARQHADQNGYRQEGMPSTFAGGKTMSDSSVTQVDIERAGLPPLRASVGMPMPSMHQYPMSRDPAQHPQLAPLSIPGSSSQGVPQHFPSSVHNGYAVGPPPQSLASRGLSPYGALQPMSEGDDNYFAYMINEVGSAGEALFARSNGNTPPAVAAAGGYMGSVGAMAEYGYGQVGPYREQAPIQAYGAHDHGRPTLPPMSFATGFDR